MDGSQAGAGSSEGLPSGTSVEKAIAQYVSVKSKGGKGRHALESKRVLEKVHEDHWSRVGVGTVGDLQVRHYRSYAEHLNRRAWAKERNPETGITGSTANHYYDLVSAFGDWLADHDITDDNLASNATAVEQLPDESVGQHEDPEQQYWSDRTREEIVRWADWRFETAADERWMDPTVASRDRALVALLAYSGLRGAEAFRDPRNDRRNGLRWSDLDFEDETVRVLGKSQDHERVPIMPPAITRLRAHKRRLDPPSDAWPVFQTTHLRSLYAELPEDVNATPDTVDELLREHEATPPSLSVNSGRGVLERLCLESGIREEGEILLPHGARRGLGDTIYQHSPVEAQKLLRHESIETTHRHYAENDTERTRTAMKEALFGETADEE